MKHPTVWQAPSPLWRRLLDGPRTKSPVTLEQPALLRFASDSFMQDLSRLLAERPADLAGHVARAETWRAPGAGLGKQVSPDAPLKLYQAAHGRFYLVAASLVCRIAGLPDRKVDAAAEERVSFVVRRLEPRQPEGSVEPKVPGSFREMAWIGDRTAGTWKALAAAGELDPGEERLPLFPLVFDEDGRTRRLHAGLVPVASAEAYAAGRKVEIAAPDREADPIGDPRMGELSSSALLALAQLTELPDEVTDREAQEILTFAALDLAGFLRRHHPELWQAVRQGLAVGLGSAAAAVAERLAKPGAAAWSLLLADAEVHEAKILAGDLAEVLAVASNLTLGAVRQAAAHLLEPEGEASFADLMRAALAELPPLEESAAAAPAAADGAWYVVRCAYERPRCRLHASPALSRPSPAFQLASFFDPDAPARPLRVTLPVDTSQQGLRRFPKGVSFLFSNELRRQVERVTSVTLGDLEDGNTGDDPGLPSLGVLCSLSIPIITIAAMILLMIIVNLLNIVFWWKPLFKICFPLKVGNS